MLSVSDAGTLFPPLDNELGLEAHQRLTPRMHACQVRLGAQEPFGQAAIEMIFHHQVHVSKESIRQHTLAAGETYVQVQADPDISKSLVPDSLDARQMMCADAAKVHTTDTAWRDVKTLTIAEVGARGKTHHITYFSRMCEYTVFAKQCQTEVRRRHLKHSQQACAVNDGADWIPEVVTACRPDAVRILDFYHATEHLATAGRAVFGEDTPQFQAWFERQRHELRDGDPDLVLQALGELALQHHQHVECINAVQGYLLKRRDLIDYAQFKAADWPIGSGAGEAAHKVVIQARMKRAGMRWRSTNVDAMAAMRNLVCNQRWHTDWPIIRACRHPQRPSPNSPKPSRLLSNFTLHPAPSWR